MRQFLDRKFLLPLRTGKGAKRPQFKNCERETVFSKKVVCVCDWVRQAGRQALGGLAARVVRVWGGEEPRTSIGSAQNMRR